MTLANKLLNLHEEKNLEIGGGIFLELGNTTVDIRVRDKSSKKARLLKSIMRPILPKEVAGAKKELTKIFKGIDLSSFDSDETDISARPERKEIKKALKKADAFISQLKFDGKDRLKV